MIFFEKSTIVADNFKSATVSHGGRLSTRACREAGSDGSDESVVGRRWSIEAENRRAIRLPGGVQHRRLAMGVHRVSPLSAADGYEPAGLFVRLAACGGCRPHRRHRQRDAQADAG